MSAILPKHLAKFQEWLVNSDTRRKKLGTAQEYARFLTRCSEHYGTIIDEQTVRTEADVSRIIGDVSCIVGARGRWVKGTFNTCDVQRNLVFALKGYARFIQATFTVVDPIQVSNDVPVDELPKRLKMEVSRLVRDTQMSRKVKGRHKHRCQLCGKRLKLKLGQFYSEGHHLKPLGQPHNGPDVEENVVCVCPNCHVLLDYCAVPLPPGALRLKPGHNVGQEFIDYHNGLHAKSR